MCFITVHYIVVHQFVCPQYIILTPRYHLTGSKAGTFDVFAENLPGLPDNISPSSSGGYWLGVAITRQSRLIDFLTRFPFVRSLIVKVCRLLLTPLSSFTYLRHV